MLPLKVLVADDHKLFRQGLISLMRTRTDLVQVIGEAATGQEIMTMALQLRPDLILMDIYMPDMNGLDAAREILKQLPNVAIVMLTSSEDDNHLYEAVQLGAAGYLLKTLDAEELFNLLHSVANGEAALTRSMATRLLHKMIKDKSSNKSTVFDLTEREMDVLKHVARGSTNVEIAEALVISVNTVKAHIHNILDKLQLENRTQAAAYAFNSGLITPVGREKNNITQMD